MKKTILFSFLVLFISNSLFALDPPDLSQIQKSRPPYQPIKFSRDEDSLIHHIAGQYGLTTSTSVESFYGLEMTQQTQIKEVIWLEGLNVEYNRLSPLRSGRSFKINLTSVVGKILKGKKNSLILIPVPKGQSAPYGLNAQLIDVLKGNGTVHPSNIVAMVISRDRIMEDLPKVSKGVKGVFIYAPKPRQANSGVNQLVIEAKNRGLPVEIDVLGGGAQVYKDVIELLPHAADQVREGLGPIKLDFYSSKTTFEPLKERENDGWDAGSLIPEVIRKHHSLLVPQISMRSFRVQDHPEPESDFVQNKKWLDPNEDWISFDFDANQAAQFAEGDKDKSPSLTERTYAANASAEGVALDVLKEAMHRRMFGEAITTEARMDVLRFGFMPTFGGMQEAVRSLEIGVERVQHNLDRYEAVRGPIEK